MPKGTELSLEILKGAHRVFVVENGLFLHFDITPEFENPSLYLLYFDASMKLKYSCYLPGFIESVNDCVISYSSLNEFNKDGYASDLPDCYVSKWSKSKGSTLYIDNKIILSFDIEKEFVAFKYAENTQDLFINSELEFPINPDSIRAYYDTVLTANLPISELLISSTSIDLISRKKSSTVIDSFVFANKLDSERFYEVLLEYLKSTFAR